MMKQMINLVLIFATILAGFPAYPQFTVPQKAYVDLNNFVVNPGAELGKSGWTTYADAAATSPVDGTGGAASSTYVSSTSSPLIGSASFLWTHSAANRQGEGFSYNFTIDTASKGKVLQGSFEYSIASGTFADDDLSVWIYDVTNATLIQPAPYKIKNHALASERFPFEFQASSSSTSYRLIVHVATSTATAYTAKFDNFKINQSAKLYGSPVTDWVSFTPTGSWSSNSTYTGKWRRIGDTLEVTGAISLTGAPTSANLTINLPSGMTIDTAKLSTTTINQVLGQASMYAAGVTSYLGNIGYSTTTAVGLLVGKSDATYASNATVTQAVPGTFANGDFVNFSFRVPIAGWSSSVIMSSDAATNVIAARYTSSAGQTISYNTISIIDFATKDFDTNAAVTTGASWKYTIPVAGTYRVSSNILYSNMTGTTSSYYVAIYKNGSESTRVTYSPYVSGANAPAVITGLVSCVAGDYIDIRTYQNDGGSGTRTLTTTAANVTVSVEKISGPAQIAASDSVSALYTGAPPTGTLTNSYNTTTFGTKVKDTHSAYSGGSYTVPVSGTYDITARTRQAATYVLGKFVGIAIYVDGVSKHDGTIEVAAAVSTIYPAVTVNSLPLLAGQVVTIRSYNDATSPTFASSATQNYFSIIRTGNY